MQREQTKARSVAPRGYLNDVRTRTIVVDPAIAPIIQSMFALYAEGKSTLEDVEQFLARNEVISRKTKRPPGGKPLHVEIIRVMLQNSFYHGDPGAR